VDREFQSDGDCLLVVKQRHRRLSFLRMQRVGVVWGGGGALRAGGRSKGSLRGV